MKPFRACLTAIVCTMSGAYAWGPATHSYIASCVTEGHNASVLFGSMLPDLNALLINNPAAATQLNRLTHREFDRLAPSALATGFKTHNALWGADYYAHLFFNPEAEDIYSTVVIRQLSTEFGITLSQAEDVFEMCVDIQIRLAQGVELGQRLALAATMSGAEHEQAMVDAFAEELANRVEDLSLEQAEQEIRGAVRGFRTLIIAFGEQLQLDESEIHEAIPPVLAMYLGCDTETAAVYYTRGLELTQDCFTELHRICEEIQLIMPEAFEGEDMVEGEGENEGEGEPVPVKVVDFCEEFQLVIDNPLLQGLDPEFAAFIELLNPATADLNGSFSVDYSGGTLSITVEGNGILDAPHELGLLARVLNHPESFRDGIRSTQLDHATALSAWRANRRQINADIGGLASLLDALVPGLKKVLLGYLTLGDGHFTITSVPTPAEPDLPIIVSGTGSFGLVAALFATLDFMIAGELGSGFANPYLNKEDYITFPQLLAEGDADGDGYTNREEYAHFLHDTCAVKTDTQTKGNDPSLPYTVAALNYRICPDCVSHCPQCAPRGGLHKVGQDACLQVPGLFPPGTPFDWAKADAGPLFGDRYEGVDCQTLRIYALTEDDSGMYVCTYGPEAHQFFMTLHVGAELPLSPPWTVVVTACILGLLFCLRRHSARQP